MIARGLSLRPPGSDQDDGESYDHPTLSWDAQNRNFSRQPVHWSLSPETKGYTADLTWALREHGNSFTDPASARHRTLSLGPRAGGVKFWR
jgi:hypothetical protein